MADTSDPLESPPTQRRRNVWGLPPIEVILLALVGGAAGLGIGLLLGSQAKAATVGAALIGAVVVAVGTYRTIQVTREGQITDRYTKAVEQLDAKDSSGHPNEVVVLGGIYALERIASDSKVDYRPIMEILTSYVRMRVPSPEGAASGKQSEVSTQEYKFPNDVQAALAVLARRSPPKGEHLRLDLQATDLRCAKLPYARFERAILREAWLSGADLRMAVLTDAKLQGAKLGPSDTGKAKFEGALLDGTVLKGAQYDTHTTWPNGFDPESRGAVFEQSHQTVQQQSAATTPHDTDPI
jgi:hypothetical protein